MKFQLITLVAALSLIAPVIATPAPQHNTYCELLISYHIVCDICAEHSTGSPYDNVRVLIIESPVYTNQISYPLCGL